MTRYAGVSAEEVGSGKALAALCYLLNLILIPFCVVPLLLRSNEFALFHAKQCLVLWIVEVVGLILAIVLTLLVFVIGLGLLFIPLWAAFVIAMNVIGILNVSNGRFSPLPLVGVVAERSLAGIRKPATTSTA